MNSVELKISQKDWFFITLIGACFGFLLSWFFYFSNPQLQTASTIWFSTLCAVLIGLFSSFLITISNNIILPKVNQKFWYIISFFFSFVSGAFGFLLTFALFLFLDLNIALWLQPYWEIFTLLIGLLTFLIGLILHQFIAMKYKNESIQHQILSTKIKALENELNPHFLFNALNSVSELIYVDSKKAESAVIKLSKFLRHAISNKSLITLEDELKMVENYVSIENIRFENKIKLQQSVQTSFYKVLVPKFSIQLLVENAIKHGFMNEQLHIYIEAIDNTIVVKNSGKITSNIRFGTGLNNLKQRLKLLDIGTLCFQTTSCMQFIITLKKG
jgi:sensor histidine kinase YesM